MCGILGIIARDGSSPSLTDSQVIAMRDRMAARGPDDATLLRRTGVVLAHRRLAIRDPDAGRQPWLSEDGRFALVYNGEIYNDDALRKDLVSEGFQFRTRCDTEVVMAAWIRWGADCARHLRGMFAFGVYDFQTQKLFLVRDRVGVKPLFFANIGNDFVFASSISAIAQHPAFRPRPNLAVVGHYLSTFRITLDDQTMFEGVHTLRPAETLTQTEAGFTRTTCWSLPMPDESPPTFDEAVDAFEQSLRESVSIRLRSDVPVGMMLSGGVDSNLLACLLKQNDDVSMTARCGGGVDPAMDAATGDFAFARRCAAHVGFDYDEVQVSADEYHATWLELIRAYDTPLSTPTDVIIHQVASQLKQTVGVALGGEGADEACCGYLIPHWSGNDYDLSRSLSSLDPETAEIAQQQLLASYGKDAFASPGEHYLIANGLIPAAAQAILFRQPHREAAMADGAVQGFYDRMFAELDSLSNALKTSYVLQRVNLESLLSRLDSATMAASLEARVPYTDHTIIEQMFRLPHSFRIDIDPAELNRHRVASELAGAGSLRGKRPLRAVAQRQMPADLALRPKASFPTPLPLWLDGKWKPWLRDLYQSSAFANEYFNVSSLSQLLDLPSHQSMWHWPIANTILWGDRWFS